MTVDNYNFSSIHDNHGLFNKVINHQNRAINSERDVKRREEAALKEVGAEDLSNLLVKMDLVNRKNGYNLVTDEFHPAGPLETHTIVKGKHLGMRSYKQQWAHNHSDYLFTSHRFVNNQNFVSSKMWKVARRIIELDLPGAKRLRLILNYCKRPVDTIDENDVHSRGFDMPSRILTVRAIVGVCTHWPCSKEPMSRSTSGSSTEAHSIAPVGAYPLIGGHH